MGSSSSRTRARLTIVRNALTILHLVPTQLVEPPALGIEIVTSCIVGYARATIVT